MMRFPSRRSCNVWFSVAALLLLEATIAQGTRGDARAGAFAQTPAVTEISRLPLPAQATISQVLGRDDRGRALPSTGGQETKA